MSFISLKCKNCNGEMTIDMNSKTCTCSHCGSTFLLTELVDEKDISFVDTFSQNDLNQKVEFNDALKQGDVCIYRGEFIKAEEWFKRAIELDENNYKGYFGLVKAKTHNFNIIPDSNDYEQYAKITMNLVDRDDESHIKNELSKLDILKSEKLQSQKTKDELLKKQKQSSKTKQSMETFFTKLAYFIVVLFTAGILFAIFLTRGFTPEDHSTPKNYEVSTVEQFKQICTDKKLLGATIILKADLDFENQSLNPIGSESNPFTGNIYGNGKKISNLCLKSSGNSTHSNFGLFGYIKNATISGLVLNNVSFAESISNSSISDVNIGLVCGRAESSSIKNCSIYYNSKINLSLDGQTSYAIGGLVGEASNTTIAYCYSQASLSVDQYNAQYLGNGNNPLEYALGGLVGKMTKTNISLSYSSSAIISNVIGNETLNDSYNIYSFVGGLVGEVTNSRSNDYYIKSCFFDGLVNSNITAITMSDSNKHVFIAGIVAHGANSYTNEIESNYALINGFNFVKNGDYVAASALGDFSTGYNAITYVGDEATMIEKISSIFAGNIWLYTNTLTPALAY